MCQQSLESVPALSAVEAFHLPGNARSKHVQLSEFLFLCLDKNSVLRLDANLQRSLDSVRAHHSLYTITIVATRQWRGVHRCLLEPAPALRGTHLDRSDIDHLPLTYGLLMLCTTLLRVGPSC